MPDKKQTKKFTVAKTTPPEKDVPPSYLQEEQDKYDFCNVASFSECTGLIPTPPQSVEEMESYMSLFDYQPPHVIHQNEEDDKNNESV